MFWSVNIVYILVGLKDEFFMSVPDLGILGSCFPIGLIIGTIIFGIIGDYHGRMYAFKSSVCISALFSLCLAFPSNSTTAGLLLLLLGAGIGGELSLSIKVLYEFCPPSEIEYLFGLALFWSAGLVLSAFMGIIIIWTSDLISSWRMVLKVGFAIEIFCMTFRFLLEETPGYCESSGQISKMKDVLNNISIQNTGKEYKFDIKNGKFKAEDNENSASFEKLDFWVVIEKWFKENGKLVNVFCIVFVS